MYIKIISYKIVDFDMNVKELLYSNWFWSIYYCWWWYIRYFYISEDNIKCMFVVLLSIVGMLKLCISFDCSIFIILDL